LNKTIKFNANIRNSTVPTLSCHQG